MVLLSDEKPIVLCAIDWIGISNGGYDVWREALAKAAGTTVDRVAIHTLHQHDAPRCDFSAEKLLVARGLGGKMFDVAFVRATIGRVSDAIGAAPEGRIDPYVRLVAFFDGERPVASLTYYACHLQSYYREGGVSADFVGPPFRRRESADRRSLDRPHAG